MRKKSGNSYTLLENMMLYMDGGLSLLAILERVSESANDLEEFTNIIQSM